jgi:hypothetical protein
MQTHAEVRDEPGPGAALLDGYELSLHLTVTGHRSEYTADTHVDQEWLREFCRVRRRMLGSGHHAVRQRPALAAGAALRGHARARSTGSSANGTRA